MKQKRKKRPKQNPCLCCLTDLNVIVLSWLLSVRLESVWYQMLMKNNTQKGLSIYLFIIFFFYWEHHINYQNLSFVKFGFHLPIVQFNKKNMQCEYQALAASKVLVGFTKVKYHKPTHQLGSRVCAYNLCVFHSFKLTLCAFCPVDFISPS